MESFKESYKSPKKLVLFLFVGFLTFAPPGTLIGIFLLLLALMGKFWMIAGLIFLLLTILGYVIIKKRSK
jgi:hypothetical protein